MDKNIVLLTAAILMAPMVGRNDIDASSTDPKTVQDIRQNCLCQAIQLWSDLEKLCESAKDYDEQRRMQ